MAKIYKSYRIPGLGIEIMDRNMQQEIRISDTNAYHQFYGTRGRNDKEMEQAQQLIDAQYPGQGWRIPNLKELRLIGELTELGLDMHLAEMDHYTYWKPIISTEPMKSQFRDPGRVSLYCVWVKPSEAHGNPVEARYLISTDSLFQYSPEIRLVRDI